MYLEFELQSPLQYLRFCYESLVCFSSPTIMETAFFAVLIRVIVLLLSHNKNGWEIDLRLANEVNISWGKEERGNCNCIGEGVNHTPMFILFLKFPDYFVIQSLISSFLFYLNYISWN